MIAMALSCDPQLLLADEPTTALDATVQVQVLILLRRLQRELGMGMIFVTHDLGVAAEIADRIAVMYAGRIVEVGPVAQVLANPLHPYTAGLLASTVHGQDKRPRHRRDPRQPARHAAPAAGVQLCPALLAAHCGMPHDGPGTAILRAGPDGGLLQPTDRGGVSREPKPAATKRYCQIAGDRLQNGVPG